MLLMEEAERIALEEHGSNKIAVISGNVNHYHRNGGRLAFFSSPIRKNSNNGLVCPFYPFLSEVWPQKNCSRL